MLDDAGHAIAVSLLAALALLRDPDGTDSAHLPEVGECRNGPASGSVLRGGNASPLASLALFQRTGALWKAFIRAVVRVFPVALYRIQLLTKSLQNLYP